MKQLSIIGVYRHKNKIYTKNPVYCKGFTVYDEKIFKYNNIEFRSWNPYKSKLSATIHNGLKKLNISEKSIILYLGAATGTTVSHFADIVNNGVVYAIEKSPFSFKKLLNLCNQRKNIIPIMCDANHTEKYNAIVPISDFIYQDISQKNQDEIFINNIRKYLKIKGQALIMIKARSIDVSLKPKQVYNQVIDKLKKNKIKILDIIDISNYEKDHAAILVSN
jgi:fibrillarin-like pre-rRNA processing protein